MYRFCSLIQFQNFTAVYGLNLLYNANIANAEPVLSNLTVQYTDFTLWQRNGLKGDVLERQLNYWKYIFKGTANCLELSLDKPRPKKLCYQGASHHTQLSHKIRKKLDKLSQDTNASLFMVLFTVFQILIYRDTGQKDIVLGTPIANRNDKELEKLVGFFVNTLPIPIYFENGDNFISILNKVKQGIFNAYENQDIPFEKIVDELGVSGAINRNPIFQVMFTFTAKDSESLINLNGLSIEKVNSGCSMTKFDLTLNAIDHGNCITLEFDYLIELFNSDTIKRMAEHFLEAVNAILEMPYHNVLDLPLLTPMEKQTLLVRWNDNTVEYQKHKTIHQLFEEQVERTPNNIAVVFEDESLTYQALNDRSNQLARFIRQQYGQEINLPAKDSLICLYLDRSIDMLIAILGVLKAGAAYVPIDPNYPCERVQFILKDTNSFLVLTQHHLLSQLKLIIAGCEPINRDNKVNLLDVNNLLYQQQDTFNLLSYNQSTDLIYVIYSSGTTGFPKGVMVEHRSLINTLTALHVTYQLTVGSKVTQYTSYIFDVSVSEIFVTLLKGAELHIVTDNARKDVHVFSDYLIQYKITHIYVPPAILAVLPRKKYSSLECIIFAGEPCRQEAGSYWAEQKKLFNYYGPTEATIYATGKLVFPGNINQIGQPIQNMHAYVLDARGTLSPIGVVGELYIGGSGLARGYLNRPELTADCFIPNPFATECDKARGTTRLYKTGDLVRWLANGQLEYIGRNDFQIKIRGYRIEPSEIEQVLIRYKNIRQSVVMARKRETAAGEHPYLVAYYVSDESIDEGVLTAYLEKYLPDYMIPSAFVFMSSLPLTLNGKLDRQAFSTPELVARNRDYAAPRTALEEKICILWQTVLGVNRIGIRDDFFRFGGNSILAIQTTHQMSQMIHKKLAVADIFHYKTIAGLDAAFSTNAQAITITATADNRARLSFAQERLWFIEQYEQGSNAYHIPFVFQLDVAVDRKILKQALNSIVSRHSILRTTFHCDDEGVPWQDVNDKPLLIIEKNIAQHRLSSALKHAINTIFNLEQDYPIRVHFYNVLDNDDVFLMITIHHIALDGWSADIFMRELKQYYEHYLAGDTLHLAPLSIQYKDFSVWQRHHVSGAVLDKHAHYWRARLADYEPLAMPLDYPRPQEINYHGEDYHFNISEALSLKLRSLAQSRGVTLLTVLLSGFYILLSKYTGQDDLVIGTPIANRNHEPLNDVMGFFVNSLPIRAQLKADASSSQLIKQVHRALIEAQRHQDLPFEQLVSALRIEPELSKHPIFQVMFGMHNSSASDSMKPWLSPVNTHEHYKIAKFDLSLFIDDSETVLRGSINYAKGLYNPETIARMASHYHHLLSQVTDNADGNFNEYQVLTKTEYQTMVYDWNATDCDYAKDKTIHQLFEEQVERTPHNIAVVFEEEQLTYQELNERANQLAHHLQTLGIKPEIFVAISLEKSLELIIGLLAILKAGGAFVSIDPLLPKERIHFLLTETSAPLILTQSFLNEQFCDCSAVIINLDHNIFKNEKSTNPIHSNHPYNLAYIMYTSGSTGKPKGVTIAHHSLTNLCVYCQNQYNLNIGPCDRVSVYANFGYDGFASEIFPYLIYGASLYIVPVEIRYEPKKISEWMHYHQITTASLPTKMAEEFLLNENNALRVLHTSGEIFKKASYKKYKIINNYGPTEGTILTTSYLLTDPEKILIGKPINNIAVHILDGNLTNTPIGIIGELYIGGAGLARGYLNKPELTAEKFIPNPFATAKDIDERKKLRLYKTGDLGRYLSDGNIEILGRIDDQVKIRGYRVELSEIERILATFEGLKECVVLVRDRLTKRSSNKYLVAYYVSQHDLKHDLLSAYLSKYLPDYMIPNIFVKIAAFPTATSGKLDKKSLPEPNFCLSTLEYRAPITYLEKKMCSIWQAVLGLERIGTADDFFRLGGNSILTIQLIAKMNKLLSVNLSVSDIFRYKNISNIIEALIINTKDNYSLLNPLNIKNTSLPTIYFIHPAGLGSEVYEPLANLLDSHYQSIGIDNYNIYNNNKINNLSEIANYYLDQIFNLFSFSTDIYLCGWSLGGQIALEMAYHLEQKGFKKIKVYLLDTILHDDENLQCLMSKLDINELKSYRKKQMHAQGADESYIEKIFNAYDAEAAIANSSLSGILVYTNVCLFKASQINNDFNHKDYFKIEKYKCNLIDNNIQKIAKNRVQIEVLDCHHASIFDNVISISMIIKNELF